jgi:Uma2 family endonuclease
MAAPKQHIPRLEPGDRLTSDEFMRRYEAWPEIKHAELIEGIVYMPSPIRIPQHSEPLARMTHWLTRYWEQHSDSIQVYTPGTIRLDADNVVEPDLFARRHEGTSRIGDDGFLYGPPELVVEVAGSSVVRDLHDKMDAYRRNGVREYIVWRTKDAAIDWFELVEGAYQRREPDAAGIIESTQFPGLRLDVAAMLEGDLAKVAAALN